MSSVGLGIRTNSFLRREKDSRGFGNLVILPVYQHNPNRMSQKKPLLLKAELLFLLFFFAGFLIWAIPRCSDKQSELNQSGNSGVLEETDSLKNPRAVANELRQKDTLLILPEPPSTKIPDSLKAVYSRLYVVIPDLKLRTGPSLDSTILQTLPLFEPVLFMEEVSSFTEEINLGYEKADEPWVRVRSMQGNEGWVYGAGVNFYKKKRKGLIE